MELAAVSTELVMGLTLPLARKHDFAVHATPAAERGGVADAEMPCAYPVALGLHWRLCAGLVAGAVFMRWSHIAHVILAPEPQGLYVFDDKSLVLWDLEMTDNACALVVIV